MTTRPEVVVSGGEGFAARGAAEIVSRLRAALAERPTAFVALAGGSTPRPVYRALAGPGGGLKPAEWCRVHFFWSDERLVQPGDPCRNVAAATEDLLAGLDLPPGNLHAPRLEVNPAASAAGYEREIRRVVPAGENGIPRLDLVLLGVGTDGHTASLFPDQVEAVGATPDAAHDLNDLNDPSDPGDLVVATRSPVPPHRRISFSFELIAAARMTLILAAGESKADIVHRALTQNDRSLPVTLVEAGSGAVCWVLDPEAAGRLL